jgi:hypothetical protein
VLNGDLGTFLYDTSLHDSSLAGEADGSAVQGHRLVVYWPDAPQEHMQAQRSLPDDLDLIQEQAPESFLGLTPSKSNVHNETAVQEQAHHGTICLMESHSSMPVTGTQTVQLGCVIPCLVTVLAVRSITVLGHVNGLRTETLGLSH